SCLRPPVTTPICALSLHDALPIYLERNDGTFGFDHCLKVAGPADFEVCDEGVDDGSNLGVEMANDCASHGGPCLELTFKDDETRSEEHTSELQSPCKPVCRLLLEK